MSINDSILFLSSVRFALKESISLYNFSSDIKQELKNFIMNEATDYQIMSLLVNETLPEEKYNLQEEISLFDEYKNIVNENYDTFSKILSDEQINNLLTEVGPISQYGYSTTKPLLEHFYLTGVLTEEEDDPYKKKLLDKVLKDKLDKKMKSYDAHHNKVIDDVIYNVKKGKEKIKDKFSGPKPTTKDLVVYTGKPDPTKSTSDKLKSVKKYGKVAAAVVLAAASIYAGYKVYKNYFSKAARSCKNLKGNEKDNCMQKFKNEAVKARINTTMKGMNACQNSKNPQKCKQIIQSKINGLKSKLKK